MTERNVAQIDEMVLLAGRPEAEEFSQYVRTKLPDPFEFNGTELLAEWRAAHEQLRSLEASEAGLCDQTSPSPLPDSMAAAAARELERTEIRQSYGILPHRWQLVDIETLVVTQRSVNLRFADDLVAVLPKRIEDRDLFELAVGRLTRKPGFQVTQMSERLLSFASSSTNLRFLETRLVRPEQVSEFHSSGYPSAFVAIGIGFGANLISAVSVGSRLILLNGTHRLYAFHRLGFRLAPCLVQFAASASDLALIGANDLTAKSTTYLHSPRPPLFKDYLDSRVHKRFQAQRTNVVLHLQLTMQQWRTPSL